MSVLSSSFLTGDEASGGQASGIDTREDRAELRTEAHAPLTHPDVSVTAFLEGNLTMPNKV